MIIRVVLKGRNQGYEYRNIYSYDYQGEDLTPAQCDSIVGLVVQKVYEPIRVRLLHSGFVLYEGEVQKQVQGREFIRFWTTPLQFTGARNVDPLPPFAAALLVGRTFTKRLRGLKYIGGLTDDVANGNMLYGDALDALKQAAIGYRDVLQVEGVTVVPVVLRRDGTGVMMSSAIARPRLFSLRRRATDN